MLECWMMYVVAVVNVVDVFLFHSPSIIDLHDPSLCSSLLLSLTEARFDEWWLAMPVECMAAVASGDSVTGRQRARQVDWMRTHRASTMC